MTEPWLQVGEEDEDTGRDLSNVFAEIHSIAESLAGDGGEWVTPAEIAQYLPSTTYADLGATATTHVTSRSVLKALEKEVGVRHGEYVLKSNRMSLNRRNDYKQTAVFKVIYKPDLPDW